MSLLNAGMVCGADVYFNAHSVYWRVSGGLCRAKRNQLHFHRISFVPEHLIFFNVHLPWRSSGRYRDSTGVCVSATTAITAATTFSSATSATAAAAAADLRHRINDSAGSEHFPVC